MSRRLFMAMAANLLIAAVVAQPAVATSVTPIKYGRWRQDEAVQYMWKQDARPPSWMRPAIVNATDDAGTTTGASAATFSLVDSAASWIGYTNDVCTDSAIGCTWNNAPTSFTIRLRPQGWSFDWGTLRWCQFYDSPPDGCFDAEMITLHELGHAQSLGHIDDAPDPGDWIDSIMHAVSHAKSKVGWNAHAFGRCDVAALQTVYQPASPSTPISTCLALSTVATLTAPSSVAYRATVKFSATLATAADVADPKLRGLPLSNRSVVIQWRSVSGSTWTTIGPMTASSTDGQYTFSQALTTTLDWRVSFAANGEGLLPDVSSAVRVTVADCSTNCPANVLTTQATEHGGGQ